MAQCLEVDVASQGETAQIALVHNQADSCAKESHKMPIIGLILHNGFIGTALDNLREALESHFEPPVATMYP